MLRSASALCLTLAFLLTLAACNTVGPERPEPPRELTAQERQLAELSPPATSGSSSSAP